ncbi:GNAT family N-acetyltransferase [Streptomyces litchfieldiae]|uniref:GNAT family N-acetyltransferase n=1 Tax=Streptomyces litchfieldiae TaxID=3075543 RepID=A0ABU2MI45_9ACTN|nr:N-acetyltransferase family protein [Streptomyces sp. DSM 44938]MDT0341252.1 GNAT family N-acetyltransferase [Streptomyces sp. DSM 44938]
MASPTPTIRFARADDMPAVCALINHYIAVTAANFRTEPLTPDEWLAEWRRHSAEYPWYVAETAIGEVAGIAYAHPWSPRGAYAWTAESVIYLSPGQRGLGVGSALYDRLLTTLRAQGYRSAIATVALPNPGSVALHRSQGFEHVGTFRDVGYKHSTWRDVSHWQRLLNTDDTPPGEIVPPATADPGA